MGEPQATPGVSSVSQKRDLRVPRARSRRGEASCAPPSAAPAISSKFPAPARARTRARRSGICALGTLPTVVQHVRWGSRKPVSRAPRARSRRGEASYAPPSAAPAMSRKFSLPARARAGTAQRDLRTRDFANCRNTCSVGFAETGLQKTKSEISTRRS